MKAYLISNPEQMKEVVPLMKWQKEKNKAAAFAKVWSITSRKDPEKTEKISARIEVGRNAQVFKIIGKEKALLGTMNLSMARAFVTGLEEIK